MGWIAWIIIGGLAGWVASMIMKRDAQMGILLNVIVGIVGGLLGGWLLSIVGLGSGGYFWTFITAVLGACILLFLVGLVQRSSSRA